MQRVDKVVKNVRYAVLFQVAGLVVSFVTRTIFVRTLGAEYLGVQGLFSNVLTVLSLAELGVAPAIGFSLYKPLADGDLEQVKSLVRLFRRAYAVIGALVLVLGLALTPFLGFLMKDVPDIPNLRLIFVMFVANSGISYFFSYKRSLIVADQRSYITTVYHYGLLILMNIVQAVCLLTTRNYVLFLAMLLATTLLENVLVSRKADRLYPFLLGRARPLGKAQRDAVFRNIRAMALHQVGGVALTGTDSFVISKFVGIVAVGFYSNYLLIAGAVATVFKMVFDSMAASVGNLGATETNEKGLSIFWVLHFLNSWMVAVATVCIVVLANPFITLAFGASYTLPLAFVCLFGMNFYIQNMRKSVVMTKTAFGLFRPDRYRPLIEVFINLVISIVLAIRIGILGVLVGTIVSTLVTSWWIEPYVLFKYGFRTPISTFLRKYSRYTLATLAALAACEILGNLVPSVTIIGFLVSALICFVVANAVFLLQFHKTEEFGYLRDVALVRLRGRSG